MTTLYGLADLTIGAHQKMTRLRLYDGPLDLSWKHCAMASDFVAELAALRYRASRNTYREVRHNIGYLTNELVENAVKFRASGSVVVEAALDGHSFRTKVSNVIDNEAAARFQDLCPRSPTATRATCSSSASKPTQPGSARAARGLVF